MVSAGSFRTVDGAIIKLEAGQVEKNKIEKGELSSAAAANIYHHDQPRSGGSSSR